MIEVLALLPYIICARVGLSSWVYLYNLARVGFAGYTFELMGWADGGVVQLRYSCHFKGLRITCIQLVLSIDGSQMTMVQFISAGTETKVSEVV